MHFAEMKFASNSYTNYICKKKGFAYRFKSKTLNLYTEPICDDGISHKKKIKRKKQKTKSKKQKAKSETQEKQKREQK